MEERNLEFLESYTIEQFKIKETVKGLIEVKSNPKDSKKLFFTFGPGKNHVGAVSKKGIPSHPVISKVKGLDKDGKPTEFYLMHEEGTGDAPVLATF